MACKQACAGLPEAGKRKNKRNMWRKAEGGGGSSEGQRERRERRG